MASRRASSRIQILCATACLGAATALLFSPRVVAGAPGPERIISLAPSITETLFALGAGPEVVGVSQYSDYPVAARRLPQVGTYLTPNVEAIVGLRPTLIIGLSSSANMRAMRALKTTGYATLTVGEGRLADIEQTITRIGHRIGRDRQAAELIADIRRHFASIEARLKNADSPKVLMLVGHQPMVAVGSANFLNQLIAMAHGTNIAANSGETWPSLSMEYVIATAPAVIIDGQMGDDPASPNNFWQQYRTIPAVKHDRLYGYAEDPILRPGPRLWQSLEILAAMIHPKLMKASADSHQPSSRVSRPIASGLDPTLAGAR